MELRLLGPVELRVAGRPVHAGGARQRSVLAALAVDVGGAVPAETLIDRVWGQAPPPRARHALHVYIARLRGLLQQAPAGTGPTRVVHRAGGYLLDVSAECVDLHRFRRLADQARDRGCRDPRRVELLWRALELWHGPPLAELPGEWAARIRQGCQQEYLDAVLGWAQACLRVGDPGAVLPRLADLTGEHPMVESLAAAYMRALYAAGRPADALAHFRTLQRVLAEELGADPGPELRELHRQVLTADPALARPVAPPPLPGRAPVPRHLPAPPPGFTGRTRELAELDRLPGSARVAVAVITGMAGVGKTALALHWAHGAADRFPDGQLYVNLHGFDPGGTPTEPAAAVRGLLDGLGVPPQRIPAAPDAQAAQYRSLLAGRRLLVVLDNAREADQVRPLLPGAPGCLAVVTSRSRLTGLVATEGAHPLVLDLLSPMEARELLANRLGSGRMAAEPDAVEEIITRCARLPLALAITAARAATHPDLALSALVADMRTARGGLDAFDTGDALADVRAVFSCSYQRIGNGTARLFRLLGLHPGPDVSQPAAASLAGVPPGLVRPMLAELTRAHLLTEPAAGRYAFHDLLRAYAFELTSTCDAGDERAAARQRMLDHYLHTAYTAARVLHPLRQRFVPEGPRPGITPEELTGDQQALAWLTTEHRVLLAVVRLAAATGHDRHTYQLAWCLTDFLDWRGHWRDWADTQEVAIQAARRLGDPVAQALAHRGMAGAHFRRGDYDSAYRHLRRALGLLDPPVAPAERAEVHVNLASVCARQGRHEEALGHARQALALYRAVGNRVGEGDALHAIGWTYALLGDHRQALSYGRQSLTNAQELGNQEGEAATWDSLGQAHQSLGDHAQAIVCYQHALELCRALGNRYYEASGLVHLGDVHHAAGDLPAARRLWQKALEILDELGHPDADQVRDKLRRPADPKVNASGRRGQSGERSGHPGG
jgi:DNA-binding SARP family transcriptional activator/tetratricopeptide (TPR) repeat protein